MFIGSYMHVNLIFDVSCKSFSSAINIKKEIYLKKYRPLKIRIIFDF